MRALPLAKGCGEDFSAMKDGHCARCDTRVHDLSKCSESEAAELLASPDVKCVRFSVERRSGDIRFRATVASAIAITIAASSVALASAPPSPQKAPTPDAGDAAPDVEYWMGRK